MPAALGSAGGRCTTGLRVGCLRVAWETRRGGYGPRQPRASKLDPFKGIIRARLAEYPELSAARLFEEVRAAGYPGGYDQVKRHVSGGPPAGARRAACAVRDAAGASGPGGLRGVPAAMGPAARVMVVLGYSRRMWLRFYERQTIGVVIHGLEESFACFGGVPGEDAVRPDEGGGARGRAETLAAAWWRTRSSGASATTGASGIRACRPYRAQTKGKVERPVRYVRGNFFYDRDFVSDDDLSARARRWLDDRRRTQVPTRI